MPNEHVVSLALLQAVQRIEAEVKARQYRIAIRKLTDALCFALSISEGQDLVLHLAGDSSVRNNRDAVAAWLLAQIADPDVLLGQQVLPIFVDLLSRKLRAGMESHAWD